MELNGPEVAYGKRKYSIEEYLEMENEATEKHEYYQGDVVALPPKKLQHNIVSMNLRCSVGIKLKGVKNFAFGSDARIHIIKNTLFTYPDMSVFCGEFETLDNDDLNFLNPTNLCEVISPESRTYDKGTKFKLYQDIPTLREYILVEPESIHIEAWYINSLGIWQKKEYNDTNDSLELPSVGVSIELRDIYEDTKVWMELGL